MSITSGVYAKARGEIIALFGWNADSLSPDQTLRIDCVVSLRLALDDLQGRIVRGESADVARMLTASEALARLLPPSVLATQPSEHREDPRQAMWQIYKTMRERGELSLKVLPPDDGHFQHRIAELEAENERLRATGNRFPVASVPRGDSAAIDPPTCDIVPPLERAECDTGPQVGADDPKPRRPGPVIEARPNSPAASAAPKYDYDKEQGWKDFVLPDGTITPTPFGAGSKYWGPVR
jgi:hypothetical protein